MAGAMGLAGQVSTTVMTGMATTIREGEDARLLDRLVCGEATGVADAEDEVERFNDILRRRLPILLPEEDGKPLSLLPSADDEDDDRRRFMLSAKAGFCKAVRKASMAMNSMV